MKEINSSEFEQEVLNGGKVVLDFYSTECPPCEAVAPKFESLAGMYGHEIKFIKMYRQANRELSDKLGVNLHRPCFSSIRAKRLQSGWPEESSEVKSSKT